jgi:hypothetical protein
MCWRQVRLACRQQAQRCVIPDAMLANDRRSFDFGSIIIVCAAKFDALNPFG